MQKEKIYKKGTTLPKHAGKFAVNEQPQAHQEHGKKWALKLIKITQNFQPSENQGYLNLHLE